MSRCTASGALSCPCATTSTGHGTTSGAGRGTQVTSLLRRSEEVECDSILPRALQP